jgi:predicted DNA-binding protein
MIMNMGLILTIIDFGGRKMKDNYIRIRTTTELKQSAQALAVKEGRTLANWIEQLIKRELEKAAK